MKEGTVPDTWSLQDSGPVGRKAGKPPPGQKEPQRHLEPDSRVVCLAGRLG